MRLLDQTPRPTRFVVEPSLSNTRSRRKLKLRSLVVFWYRNVLLLFYFSCRKSESVRTFFVPSIALQRYSNCIVFANRFAQLSLGPGKMNSSFTVMKYVRSAIGACALLLFTTCTPN